MASPGAVLTTQPSRRVRADMFDVGLNEKLPPGQLLLLGLQNVFGMTGMFIFPGIIGRVYHLPAEQIAYLYGVTFIVCGAITIFQSIVLLRLPIIQGPYAGTFAALLAVAHVPGGTLGIAFGSLFVAALIFCILTVPIRGRSLIGVLVPYLRSPLMSGMMVMLTMIQVAGVTLPGWIGPRTSPGFGAVNLASGAIALAVLISVMLWGGTFRRGFVLAGLAAGTLFFAVFRPISFGVVANAPWLVAPIWAPFGIGVRFDFVVIFLLTLIPAIFSAIALYQMVADWGGEALPPGRVSEGLFAMSVGAAIAGLTGGFSTMVYPDCIGILRSTRVLSRYATLSAGVILVVLGSVIKFDMLMVIVPLPILAAAATLLFGIVFMHGVQMLNMVEWDDRTRIAGGLALLVGLGGLFVSPDTLQAMPLFLRLLLAQPIISGGVTLVVISALLGLLKTDIAPAPALESAEPQPRAAV